MSASIVARRACDRAFPVHNREIKISDFTRRTFIAASCAALAAAPAPVLDTHIHLYDPSRPQGVPWPPKTDQLLYKPFLPETFAALVRPLGVTGAVVIEASPWLEDNQWVLDLAQDHPIIAGFIGHLEPGAGPFREHLARFANNPLFRGIRLGGGAITAGVPKREFISDLERLAGAGLTLDAIGNASMIPALVTLSDSIPNLRIVINHMPAEPPGWRSTALFADLASRPKVYAKVSGVLNAERYREGLDEVWKLFGEDRVLYGSNWPVSDKTADYAAVIGAVRKYFAIKGDRASSKYFARNAVACYGLGYAVR